MHPYWERTPDGLTGWVFTRPTPPRSRTWRATPFASCSYWDPAQEVAVAECDAVLAGDAASRRRLWELVSTAPEPLGYDPPIMGCTDALDPVVTVLRMTPWRLSTPTGAWQRPAGSALRPRRRRGRGRVLRPRVLGVAAAQLGAHLRVALAPEGRQVAR